MSGDFAAGDDSDAEALLDLEDFPGLRAVVRFTRLAPDIAWFSRLGAELEDDEIEWAEAYLAALGFPGADVVPILDWEDAEAAADNPDWNSAWWEAEEQLRMALIDEACQRIDQDNLSVALTHLASQAAEPIRAAAEAAAARDGILDNALILALQGNALQACHQAALVLAAEVEDEHAFAVKFRLLEAGRWPIALSGNSFNLF